MATMIPDVPVTSRPDAGEARVYLALRELPDAYRIYHSVSYYVAPEGGRPLREGEIDFLILHPEQGLLVLEVKGGLIGYDGRQLEWMSCDHSGTTHLIQDPFKQSQQNEKS
jgi:Nuclease-related domain